MHFTVAVFILLTAVPCFAEPHLPVGVEALPSAAGKGRGPLALVNLNHHVLGHAKVFGGQEPDLFVAGYGGPQAVHLFRWVARAEDGALVFAEPLVVKCDFKDKGVVHQKADGITIALWPSKDHLVTTKLQKEPLEFVETGRSKLPAELKGLGIIESSYLLPTYSIALRADLQPISGEDIDANIRARRHSRCHPCPCVF